MLKSFFVTLTAISTTLIAFSQPVKPQGVLGYVVSSKGDTLRGEVNYLKKTGYRQSMQIKLDDQTTKVCNARNYKFVKAGDAIFESFSITTGDVAENQFFWRKSSGKIDFYEYQYEIYQANNMVTKSEFYVRKNGSNDLIRLNGANFRKKLGELIADPKVAERLEAKETKLEDVEEILNEYNKGA